MAWNFSTAMPSTRERHRIVPPSPASAAAASRSSPRSVPMASIKRLVHGSSTTTTAASPVASPQPPTHPPPSVAAAPGSSPRWPPERSHRAPSRAANGGGEARTGQAGQDPASPRAEAEVAAAVPDPSRIRACAAAPAPAPTRRHTMALHRAATTAWTPARTARPRALPAPCPAPASRPRRAAASRAAATHPEGKRTPLPPTPTGFARRRPPAAAREGRLDRAAAELRLGFARRRSQERRLTYTCILCL